MRKHAHIYDMISDIPFKISKTSEIEGKEPGWEYMEYLVTMYSSTEDIKTKYKNLSNKSEYELSEKEKLAFEQLSDPHKRFAYDMEHDIFLKKEDQLSIAIASLLKDTRKEFDDFMVSAKKDKNISLEALEKANKDFEKLIQNFEQEIATITYSEQYRDQVTIGAKLNKATGNIEVQVIAPDLADEATYLHTEIINDNRKKANEYVKALGKFNVELKGMIKGNGLEETRPAVTFLDRTFAAMRRSLNRFPSLASIIPKPKKVTYQYNSMAKENTLKEQFEDTVEQDKLFRKIDAAKKAEDKIKNDFDKPTNNQRSSKKGL